MKIISFSIWGDNPKYTLGAIRNAELTPIIYPGWISRFYCGSSVPKTIIDELKSLPHIQVIEMEEAGNWTSMCWRFYPASEEDVEFMISRDSDSRIDFREKAAVDEWISSGKSLHIMRDHKEHTSLIMGGMWGIKGNAIQDIKKLIEDYHKGDFWQVDQNFLNSMIYPKLKDDAFIHDEFHNYERFKNRFPTERHGSDFVGQRVNEFEERE
jgi:hypothetical protein